MASKPLSGAAKRRKKKDLQNELKKRCKIDSFLLPAQTKKEETQSVANVRNEENEQEPQEDTRGSEVSELQIDTNSQVNSFKDNKKNYLRNSMGQERLSGLALLSIEASRAKVMDVDQLIDRFAEIKSRRKDLS